MRFILLYLFLLVTHKTIAQSPVLYFRNLGTNNGLSHNKVNCILQDKRGFVWIGTDDGLNRYDGQRFQTYRHNPDTFSVSGNIITDLLEDGDGVLWISTADGGITRYDHRLSPEKQFRQFKHSATDSNSIPSNIINALLEDKQGYLWLATSGQGLLRFDKKLERFSEPIRRRARTILALAMDANGIIWGGREGGGLIKIDPRTMVYKEDERYRDLYAKLPHMVVASLYSDSERDMWIGSWDKVIYKANIETSAEEVFKQTEDPYSYPADDPLAFAEDSKRRVWIGGKYEGLYIYDRETGRFHQYRRDPAREGSLADNRVNAIYVDRSGIVWLGTNRGISMHDPSLQQFSQTFLPPAASGATVFDFLNDEGGHLLIASSNGLYYRHPNGFFEHRPLTYKGEKLAATKLLRNPGGGLYVGTNMTLFRYTNASLSLLPNTEKDVIMGRIIESRIVSMMEDTIDSHPVLFVIPYGHYIAYYDYTLNQWVHRRDTVRQILQKWNVKDNLVRKFFRSKDGTVWVATVKAGLGEWRKGQQIEYYCNIPGDNTTIRSDNIYDISEDNSGNLWVSTYGGGLHYFDKKTRKFQHITASHNLAEGIQTDSRGNVWMIANGHLHKYDPYRKAYTTFHLPDAEKTGGVKGYIFKDETGKMYLAGAGYYIAFHPDQVRDQLTQPSVYFTDFKVFGDSYSHLLFNKQIELRYNENFFSVEYAAPSYHAGYPVQYQHKLDGVDADWVSDQGKADYTNLDGGDYVFKVRATVKPGVWSSDFATVNIYIIPPFWKTWWFYVTILILMGLIVYGVYRYRINELLKRQAIRNKIAQDLHDNVGSTLSSISVYSQVAKIYKQQEKHEALRDTLEKISNTSSEMISEMNDIVWAINPRNDSMETILQRMESFARPLLASQQIQFHFHCDEAVKQIVLEMTKRKNFYLIFKEAVNNALKYSECRNLWVDIKYRYQQLELTVRDDGKGFNAAKARSSNSMSGNGLQNMQIRAREMKGSWLIDSVEHEGTRVTLLFPIP